MYRIFYFVSFLFVLFAFSSCNVDDYPNRNTGDTAFICFLDKYTPGFIERYTNQQNIKKLKIGMTKQEVFSIMGEPLMYEKYAYNKPNVWYYYADWDWADAAKTETECTPLVFEDGRLIGWGLVFYRQYKHKDWLFNNQSVFDKYRLEQ